MNCLLQAKKVYVFCVFIYCQVGVLEETDLPLKLFLVAAAWCGTSEHWVIHLPASVLAVHLHNYSPPWLQRSPSTTALKKLLGVYI